MWERIRTLWYIERTNGDEIKITSSLSIKDGQPVYTQHCKVKRCGKKKWQERRQEEVLATDEELSDARVSLWNDIYPEWIK